MSSTDYAGDLQIPTVTSDDLLAFHAKHFTHAQHAEPLLPYENEELDDGLGYYSDGVKRTLTDEQIAMFRHSEIQKLLRERTLREEAELELLEQTPGPTHVSQQKESVDLQKAKKPDAIAKMSSSKKQRPSGKQRAAQRTKNRNARELDEVQAEKIELDY